MASDHEYCKVPQQEQEKPHISLSDEEQEFATVCLEDRIEFRSPMRHSPSGVWKYRTVVSLSTVVVFTAGVLLGLAVPEHFKNSTWLNNEPTVITRPVAKVWEVIPGTQCGNSWKEAVALGCHFDLMASGWYSSECFDQELLDTMWAESQTQTQYTFFQDQGHTEPVASDKALRGEYANISSNSNYHVKHCLYTWRRLHNAIIQGRGIDDDIFSWNHTLHCTTWIMEWMEDGYDDDKMVVWLEPGRPSCRHSSVELSGTIEAS